MPDSTAGAMPHAVSRPADAARRPVSDPQLLAVVTAARAGDDAAWSQLIRRFEPGLRRIARSYRLSAADVDDVVQTTWLELFRHFGAIRDPAAIAGWLATTTRRTALRTLQSPVREHLTDDRELGDDADWNGPEARLLATERRDVLARALSTLPDRHRRLMTTLVAHPTLDYREVGRLVDMPVGSIGPIRARCLERLARHDEVRALVS